MTAPEPPGVDFPLPYDRTTVVLHWLSVVLVAALWLGPQLVETLTPPSFQAGLRSSHIALGGLLGVVLIVRLLRRAGLLLSGRAPRSGVAARAMHLTLYLLLGATIGLGGLRLWAHGETIFHLVTVPGFAPADHALSHTLAGLHGLGANLVLILMAVHVVAALAHHYLWHDGLLFRILPGLDRRRPKPGRR